MAAAEEERAVEGRYWLDRIVEKPYQNPQNPMYCGERLKKDNYIAWFDRIKRRKLAKKAYELLVDEFHHPNGGHVVLTKPPRPQQRRADTHLQCSAFLGCSKFRFVEFSLNPKTMQMSQREGSVYDVVTEILLTFESNIWLASIPKPARRDGVHVGITSRE